jgi:hypothetical protein
MKYHSWQHIVALDDSWFYFSADDEFTWLPSGGTASQRERRMINSPKLMLAIVWNPQGFHAIDVLPEGDKVNCDYYISDVLGPVSQILLQYRTDRNRRFVIHIDKTRLHCSGAVQSFMIARSLRMAPHRAYLPDFTLSYFWLFGSLKGKLPGMEFDEAQQPLSSTIEILTEATVDTLNQVFEEWMRRLQPCTNANGDLVE